MLAGSEFAGANGLPHGAICEIAKRFSAPLMCRLPGACEMQAARIASNRWTAFGFYFPASRSWALCSHGLAEWRFHRTNGCEPILVSRCPGHHDALDERNAVIEHDAHDRQQDQRAECQGGA